MRSGVVVITGVTASGRPTIAQALAEHLARAAHVRGDVFRRMIVSGREEYGPGAGGEAEDRLRWRHRLATPTADVYAAAGFTAVVQDVPLGEALTAFVERIRARPLYVVVLAPDPGTVAAREAGRPKTGYGAWTVEALDGALRSPNTPRIGLWLDNSAMTVGETAHAIPAGAERARVA